MKEKRKSKEQILNDLEGAFKRIFGLRKFEDAIKKAEWDIWLLRQSIESVSTGVTIADLDGKILYTNPAEASMHGYSVEELIGKDVSIFMPREYKGGNKPAPSEIGEWKEWTRELIEVRKDRTRFPVQLKSIPVKDSKRNPVCIITISDDISERKAAEEGLRRLLDEKETLLNEVHHRMKNNLAVIQSLLKLQSSHIADEKSRGYFVETENRVRSMSMIHDQLSRAKDLTCINFSEYIRKLAVRLFKNYELNASRVKMEIDITDVTLDVDTVIPCALIVNELISNAFKYAFPDGRKGEMFIGLTNGANNEYTLVVRDNGVGLPEGLDVFEAGTMGFQIVTSLTGQIGGRLDVGMEGGTEFRLTFTEKAPGLS